MAMINCEECGQEISEQARSCPLCGRVYAGKSKIMAVFLAIFFGFLGLQYFYLGYWVSGIISILFAWTGIPSIIGIISAIYYLCISDAKFQKLSK